MSVDIKNMTLLAGKLVVYDGACPLCISLRDKVLRWNILPKNKVANYYELDADLQGKIDPERFTDEMALIDLDGQATIYGPYALKRIFSEKWTLVRWFFAIPGIMQPISFVYKTLAYNRYVVSTPRKDMPTCNCATAAPAILHVTYLAYSLLVAIAVTFLFGMGLQAFFPAISKVQGGVAMLAIAGTGWIVQGLVTWLGFGEKRFQYLRHMFTIMRMGVMPLLLVALLMLIFPQIHPVIPCLAVLYSSSMMLRQHYLRVWQLGASQWWTASWFAALQVTAIAWVVYFFNIL